MAEMLGVTNPVPGHDNTNIGKNHGQPSHDPNIKNVTDLDRVNRGDGKTDQKNAGDDSGAGRLQYSSNFGTFLQKLQNSRNLSQTLAMMMLRYSTVVTSGLEKGVASEMHQLMNMLKMDQPELLKFVTDQLSGSSRFSGALFTALREAMTGGGSEAMKSDVMAFLKSYSNFTSTDHVETNLLRTMDKLSRSVPASWGNKIATLTGELEALFSGTKEKGEGTQGAQSTLAGQGATADSLAAGTGKEGGQSEILGGDRQEALKLLQGKIIPLLAEYTTKTHDMGLSRALISVLSFNTARLEAGSQETLISNFHQLNNHAELRPSLGGLTDDSLLKLIRNSSFMQATEQNVFANHLIEATAEAMTGESGSEIQETFKEILRSFLVNESVYMPLNHLTIPLEYDGIFMFSQLWVDPDSEDNVKKGQEGKEPVAKVLIKMDIEDLGAFDLVAACQKDGKTGLLNTEMLINCPDEVAEHSAIVHKEITRILEENGLEPKGVQIGKMEIPLTVSAVFPKIYEGENSINVKA